MDVVPEYKRLLNAQYPEVLSSFADPPKPYDKDELSFFDKNGYNPVDWCLEAVSKGIIAIFGCIVLYIICLPCTLCELTTSPDIPITKKHVKQWLQENHFGEHVNIFRDYDGKKFFAVGRDEESLESLGIKSEGVRDKIMELVAGMEKVQDSICSDFIKTFLEKYSATVVKKCNKLANDTKKQVESGKLAQAGFNTALSLTINESMNLFLRKVSMAVFYKGHVPGKIGFADSSINWDIYSKNTSTHGILMHSMWSIHQDIKMICFYITVSGLENEGATKFVIDNVSSAFVRSYTNLREMEIIVD